MRFADPWYLLLLVALLAGYWYIRRWHDAHSAALPFSSVQAVLVARPVPWWRTRTLLLALRAAAFACCVIALARPQQGQRSEELVTKGVDIILCIDTSTSMRALDFKPLNRLDAAKEAARAFIKNRRHDRIGIVVFAALSYTQCPLTLDYGAALDFLDTVEIGMTQADGTAIGDALITALNRLKGSEAKSKIIILLTDGRNNAGQVDPVTASQTAAALGVKIYTIGAGKTGGAIYPVDDPLFGRRYITLPEDLDEGTLKGIAETTRGLYFRAESAAGLKQIYAHIDKLEKTEIKMKEYTDYNDLYLAFLLAGVLLLAGELVLANTALRKLP